MELRAERKQAGFMPSSVDLSWLCFLRVLWSDDYFQLQENTQGLEAPEWGKAIPMWQHMSPRIAYHNMIGRGGTEAGCVTYDPTCYLSQQSGSFGNLAQLDRSHHPNADLLEIFILPKFDSWFK